VSEKREHLYLVCAGESALHRTNENGVCEYCGRLYEEIQAGNFPCTGYQGFKFTGTKYANVPRHPLFIDAIIEIRNCDDCSEKKRGFCKKHNSLRQFLC
jgi:hypothetical protein